MPQQAHKIYKKYYSHRIISHQAMNHVLFSDLPIFFWSVQSAISPRAMSKFFFAVGGQPSLGAGTLILMPGLPVQVKDALFFKTPRRVVNQESARVGGPPNMHKNFKKSVKLFRIFVETVMREYRIRCSANTISLENWQQTSNKRNAPSYDCNAGSEVNRVR